MNNRATNVGRQAVALKEWAVVVRALASGEQILLLRKGGIAEETKAFLLLSPSFYFMETFEHQKAALLKPEAQATLEDTLRDWHPDAETVPLSLYGEVTEELEIRDQETLDKLYPYHIWTQEMAEQRLRWKRKEPLHLLLIRAWRLTEAAHVPMRSPYLGCKSWVSIEDEVPQASLEPVLTDTEYEARCRQIREALG